MWVVVWVLCGVHVVGCGVVFVVVLLVCCFGVGVGVGVVFVVVLLVCCCVVAAITVGYTCCWLWWCVCCVCVTFVCGLVCCLGGWGANCQLKRHLGKMSFETVVCDKCRLKRSFRGANVRYLTLGGEMVRYLTFFSKW